MDLKDKVTVPENIWSTFRKAWLSSGARIALETVYPAIEAGADMGKTDEAMRVHLRAIAKKAGVQNWCRDSGISMTYFYAVLAGRRPMTDRVSKLARYKRKITFVRMNDDE